MTKSELVIKGEKMSRAEDKAKRELEKEIHKRIKEQAKNFGYKFRSYSVFKKHGEYFISSNCFVCSLEKAIIHVSVKKLIYDDIFWDVMNMSSNKDQPLSLRAVGAFTAPDITVCRKEIPILSDIDAFVSSFYQLVIDESTDFLLKNPLDDYILSQSDIPRGDTLKCLVYLSRNDTAAAICEAKNAIATGDHLGGFENEGKGFFDWILFRFDQQEVVENSSIFMKSYQGVSIENSEQDKTFVDVVEPEKKETGFISKMKTIIFGKNGSKN